MDAGGKFPPLKWAQRADNVIMTVDATDAEQINIDVIEETQTLHVDFVSHGEKYNMDLVMFDKIVKEESKWNTKGRNIFIIVSKEDKEQEEWWPRITKEKVKNHFITIDFNKWINPDDSGDEKKDDNGMGGMDPSMMQGMGGAGGMGGMGGGMPGMGGMGGGMPGMGGMGGMPGMGGMGGGGPGGMGGMDLASMMGGMGGAGGGGMDPAAMQKMMAQMGGMGMGGAQGGDSDDEDGAEAQVDPHAPGGEHVHGPGCDHGADGNLDDLDGEEESDLKK